MVTYHDEIEADFQQYYHLDLNKIIRRDFWRAGRLFAQLPPKSRVMMAINPAKDWDWDKETQSRILAKLDELHCSFINVNKKKGVKKSKPAEQWQPKYVKEAKAEAEKREKEKKKMSKAQMEDFRAFWQQRNPNVRMT